MTYNPKNIFTQNELLNVIKSNRINCDIIIRGEFITSLGDVEKIKGFIGFSDSGIEDLGNLKEVKHDFWLSSHTLYSKLNSLNKLEVVGGEMCLRYSNIKDLGNLKKVGGKLNLRDTQIETLGSLEYVGGDLFLPKRLKNITDLSNITIKGKIRYWKDNNKKENITPKSKLGLKDYGEEIPIWTHKYVYSYQGLKECNLEQKQFYKEFKKQFFDNIFIDLNGNDNYVFILFYDLLENHNSSINELIIHFENLEKYYPKTKGYTKPAIIQELESNNDFNKAWELIYSNEYIGIETIIKYESKLNQQLLDGEIITKLVGFSHLTEFGQNNIQDIKSFVTIEKQKYLLNKGKAFFDIFLKNGKPHKLEYYQDLFISSAEYKYYKSIDDNQRNSNYSSMIPHVVEKAIFSQCRLIVKKAEDSYRKSIGMPKVGEGWISETELFYKISNYFKEDEVIHHASPKWLGRQHLDIYLPKLNIGIEYQGAQHYEPIEFFGGQEAYEKTVERDKRKKQLCLKHNCTLIYADKGYDINKITSTIEEIKTVQNKYGFINSII
mgnify:CR=1 FL=1